MDNLVQLLNEAANNIFQSHFAAMIELLKDPVRSSQVMYSKRIIGEATLDVMEEPVSDEMTLDDKKESLLATIEEDVSNNYRKLKEFGKFLTSSNEFKEMGEKILREYAQYISEKDKQLLPQESIERITNMASEILRDNYEALSLSIDEPFQLASLLDPQLNEKILGKVELYRSSLAVSIGIILKAVRSAVHESSEHLELLVSALRKFEKTVPIADTIFKEYIRRDPEQDSKKEVDCYNETLSYGMQSVTSTGCGGRIYLPPGTNEKFTKMRIDFGATFFQVRREIEKKKLDPEELKLLLRDCLPDYKSQFSDKNFKSIFDILELVKEKCSLVNIHCLKTIVKIFKIKKAMVIIKKYEEQVDVFCEAMTIDLCLDQKFEVVRRPQPLLCEKLTFILNWEPQDYSLKDVMDVLTKCTSDSSINVQITCMIDTIGKSNSIAVDCYIPMSQAGYVVAIVFQKVKHAQVKALSRLIWRNVLVWDKHTTTSDEDIDKVVEQEKERAKQMKDVTEEDIKKDIEEEKAGKIYIYEAGIQLNSPLAWQCENALGQLSQDHHEVHLFYSSSKIAQLIIMNLHTKRSVTKLGIYRTPISDECATFLADALAENKIQELHELTLFLTPMSESSLNIILQSLQENSTLNHFYIRDTSISRSVSRNTETLLAAFLEKNTTLTKVYLYAITLSEDFLPILFDMVARSKAHLTLDRENKEAVATFPGYGSIMDRIHFSM
ncbi:PREDICTED: uncharacterized protein LOC109580450 [Amphimedon queenslandica]|uniref:Uncharacterized protein n=1 Tax=Amphimedon queenslandica TaxID=400682 RepID=A0A1X7VFT2_AMPQE|nr:PREDICTED: uncharacterized protein LOC109580450 [Amphimedon queenslandica]|eukprot:XP_019849161.1 PREDICTED: uncharacterized protein LOC109580450 [Amphimedon queenslandica]